MVENAAWSQELLGFKQHLSLGLDEEEERYPGATGIRGGHCQGSGSISLLPVFWQQRPQSLLFCGSGPTQLI